jgi:hypothetical protein
MVSPLHNHGSFYLEFSADFIKIRANLSECNLYAKIRWNVLITSIILAMAPGYQVKQASAARRA